MTGFRYVVAALWSAPRNNPPTVAEAPAAAKDAERDAIPVAPSRSRSVRFAEEKPSQASWSITQRGPRAEGAVGTKGRDQRVRQGDASGEE
jgi:hypothetical protein